MSTTATVGAQLGTLPPRSSSGDGSSGVGRPTRLILQLSASNLSSLVPRRGGSPDFFATVECSDPNGGDSWVSVGKTEAVYNSSNPAWATSVSLEYSFGSTQLLRFRVHRHESTAKRSILGEVKCTVAHIVLADNQVRHERLTPLPGPRLQMPPHPAPTLTIRAEEERGDLGDSVTLQFSASSLRHGRKPFYTLMRKNLNDDGFSPVKFSEVHRSYDWKSANLFKPLTISMARLVNSDPDRLLRIEFSEYDRRGNHYRGGHADFTLNSLNTVRSLSLKKDKRNSAPVPAGSVKIVKYEISNSYTFLDYISAGININAIIAVDMSSTNGNPRDPHSLQYNSRTSPNEYVLALREVGSVLAEYDTDKKFPAYGFSACLPPTWEEMSYCFALSRNFARPHCDGIEGVVNAYYDSLDRVAPHAPCMLNHVMKQAVKIAQEEDQKSEHSTYTVLLVITDGDYSDQKAVADTICAATDLPLSIVIVGIGNSEFPLLDELDGDDVRLCNSHGIPASRDIVQVVHFHKHKNNPAALARETLAEIPAQLLSYMRSQGLRPSDIGAIRRRVPISPPTTPGSLNDATPPTTHQKPPPTPELPHGLKNEDMSFALPHLQPSLSQRSGFSLHSHYSGPPSFGSTGNPVPQSHHHPPAENFHSPLHPPAEMPSYSSAGSQFMTLTLAPGLLQQHLGHQTPTGASISQHAHQPPPPPVQQHPHLAMPVHFLPPPGVKAHQTQPQVSMAAHHRQSQGPLQQHPQVAMPGHLAPPSMNIPFPEHIVQGLSHPHNMHPRQP